MGDVLFQTSLIASFVAGVVALFAPCCITFLLPAYLGNVFKEKEKVLFMTLVFGAGIFVVLLPAVLGVAIISKLLFDLHQYVYLLGAVAMFVVAAISFLGLKLPMPHLPGADNNKTDVLSIFTLGIFSGITSACCAPVLIGILTLTFLSPSFFGALMIGAMYVLGIVTPLLLIALFLDGKMPAVTLLRKCLFTVKIFGRGYGILTSNLIAAVIFFFTGILIFYLTLTGKLAMDNLDSFTKMIQNTSNSVTQIVGNNIIVNGLFLILILFLIYKITKMATKVKKENHDCCESKKDGD